MNVRLTEEQKIRILNTEDLYGIMQRVLLRENKISRKREHFWVVGLDNENKVLFIELISLGNENRAIVSPRFLFRTSVHKSAAKVIFVHNHPNGTTSPSNADVNLTDKFYKAGQIIDIEVVDHLIITEEKYFSFDDNGMMQKIKESGLYEIVEKEKVALVEMKARLDQEKKVIRQIAIKMKEEGYDIEAIKKLTGLKKWDIKAL